MDEYKFVNPSTSVNALTLPPAYPDGFRFKPPTLPPDWGDKGAEGQQRLAAKMSAWVTTILIIIALLAIVYAIFRKCQYVSSLPRVCFPLYPFNTILLRHHTNGYFCRGGKSGLGRGHMGTLRNRSHSSISVKDYGIPTSA